MPLTNTVKELEENLDFGIQKLINLDKIQNKKTKNTMVGDDGDADALGPGVFGVGLGATTRNKRNEMCSHKNLKMRKRKPL